MANYELKNGFGSIFKNKFKESEKHPDYKGELKTPSGEHLEISLWVKEGAKGKFFSLSVQEPYKKEEKPEEKEEIDDLPF